MQSRWALVLISLSLAGCSHKQVLDRDSNTVSKPGVLTLSASTLTSTPKTYDIDFEASSDSIKGIMINASDMACYRANEKGTVKSAVFGRGVWSLTLANGAHRRFHLTCTLAAAGEGNPRVVIKKITEDTGDSDTLGPVVAADVEWKLPQ